MKKLLILSLLAIITASTHSQGVGSIRQLINGEPCTDCDVYGRVAFTEHLNYVILGANEEFVLRTDTLQKLNGTILTNLSRHAVLSASFAVDFIPPKKSKNIPYHELEYQVLQNSKVIQQWKGVSDLPREKDYSITCDETGDWTKVQECPAFQAGRFNLNVGDLLLVQIREKSNSEALRNISIERPRMLPVIEAVRQFPAGTGIQDILNKELKQLNDWTSYTSEIEVKPGNSILISFALGLNSKRIIEYAFTDDPENWKTLTSRESIPSILPAYLFIDNPSPGKTVGIMLRHADQRESVRHLKIIVKPKLTQTTAFILSASLALAFLLFMIIYYFLRRRNRVQVRQLLSKKKDLENKLQLLSGQLNPHFLFNSLNSIQNLVNKTQVEEANAYISQVAGFLRTVMDAGKKEFISLQEELDITEAYLQLELKKRSFRYSILNFCETDLSQIDFLPLLLQPVLENSIHHGLTKETVDPLLTIQVSCKDKDLHMLISDNGKGYDVTTVKKGHGLELVEKRISLMNEKPGNKIEMHVTSEQGKGTTTIFTFNNWL
jgi:hypothetical protein